MGVGISALVCGGVIVASRDEGYPEREIVTESGTRWLVHQPTGSLVLADGVSGRVMVRLDTERPANQLRVAQGAGGAFVLDDTQRSIAHIDEADVQLEPGRDFPAGLVNAAGLQEPPTTLGVGTDGMVITGSAGTQGFVIPDTGDIRPFAVRPDRRSSMVSSDGAVWSILASGEVERVLGSNSETFQAPNGSGDLQLTVAGERAAVLSTSAGELTWFPDGRTIELPARWSRVDVVLQQPTEQATCAWVGQRTALGCFDADGTITESALVDVELTAADSIFGTATTVVVRRPNGSLLSIDPATGTSAPLSYRAQPTTTVMSDRSGAVWVDDPLASDALVVNGQNSFVIDKLDARVPTFSASGAPAAGTGGSDGGGGGGAGGGELGSDPIASTGIEPDNDSINDPPIAVDDDVTGRSAKDLQVVVTANDYDPDGGAIFVRSTTPAEHGSISIISTSTVLYQPDSGYVGGDSFRYTIADESGLEATAVVTIDVLDASASNLAPTAVADARETAHARAVVIDVLGNDVDPEQEPLAIGDLVPPPADLGTLDRVELVDGRPALRFTPDRDYRGGVVQFRYRAVDIEGAASNEVTVSVDVAAPADANRPPIAIGDAAQTRPGVPIRIAVLANDRDPDNDDLVITRIDIDGRLGSAQASNGEIVFEPAASARGQVAFYYTIADRFAETATATVLVQIIEPDLANRPPIAQADFEEVFGGEVVLYVLRNDVDPDNDTITVISTTQPSVGAVVSNDGRSLRYRPDLASTERQTQFEYTISDGNGNTDSATVYLSLSQPEDAGPPVAGTDSFTTVKNVSVTRNLLANDTNPAGGQLIVVGTPTCAFATCTVSPDGLLTYAPNTDYTGIESFTYRIRNSRGATADGTVFVEVVDSEGENLAPLASPDTATVRAGERETIDVLANDTDPEGEALTIVEVGRTSDASEATISSDGRSIVFSASTDPNTTSNFEYTISDPGGERSTARVSVRIEEASTPLRPPVATDDFVELLVDTSLDVNVLDNDVDPDGLSDALRVTGATVSSGTATARVIGNRSVRIEPGRGFVGTVRVAYTVADADGLTATGTLVAIVAARPNTAPKAAADSASTSSGVAIVIPVLSNDGDPDGDLLTVRVISQPPVSAGVAAVIPDGRQVQFTPAAEFSGTTTFSYVAIDAEGLQSEAAVVTVTVVACAQSTPIVSDRLGEFTKFDTPLAIDLLQPSQTDFAVATSNVSGGTISAANQSGRVVFTPTRGNNGSGSFTYAVTNQCGITRSARVEIDVNRSPVINVASAIETEENTSVEIAVSSVASDDETVLFTSADVAGVGTVEIINGGTGLRYTPPARYRGAPELRVTVTDAGGLTASATLRLIVNPTRNQSPVAFDDVLGTSLEPGQASTVSVLDNDSDPDGPAEQLRVMLMSSTVLFDGVPAQLSVSEDGRRVRIDVPAGLHGTGSFSYRAVDAQGGQSEPAKVIVYANRRPNPVALAASVAQGGGVTVDATAGGNPDPDGDKVFVAGARSDSSAVTVEMSGTSLNITAAPGSVGTQATILFSIVDTYGAWSVSSLTVTITE
jgi:hypothetical protein